MVQSQLGVASTGTELLGAICRSLGADTYLTLPFVEKHLDLAQFRACGITVRFAPFRPLISPQLWGAFRYNLSAVDLLFNCGPKSLDIIAHARER